MRLRKVLIATLMMSASVASHAVPNIWVSGFGQGNTEITITNPQKATFTINCTMNPDDLDVLQHAIYLKAPDGQMMTSHNENMTLAIVMNNRQYIIPSSLGWRAADEAWEQFMSEIRNVTHFAVYANDTQIARFNATLKNAQSELPEVSECTNAHH